MSTDRHLETPLSLRLGRDRRRLEEYARAAGVPVRRVIAIAVREWLDERELVPAALSCTHTAMVPAGTVLPEVAMCPRCDAEREITAIAGAED